MTAEPPPQRGNAEAPPGPRLPFALIGFYLSCAGVALGATIGSAGFLWFESTAALVFGVVATLVCAVTCYLSLRSLRR